ncbi:MAG: hypothetical protein ABFD52_00630 [Acidobacteriota bacterium]
MNETLAIPNEVSPAEDLSCEFVNKRAEPVQVLEFGGRVLLEVLPGQTFLVEMYDRSVYYAPFSRITFLPKDRVEVEWNKAWRAPDHWRGLFLLECANNSPEPIQVFYPHGPHGEAVSVYKGVPRLVPLFLDSPYIRLRRIEWREVTEQAPAEDHDYLVTKTEVKLLRTERTASEMQEVEAALKKRAKEQVERRHSHPAVRW